MFNALQGPTTQKMNGVLKKEKRKEHANENELLLGSFGVVLEVNERGKNFHKSLRDLVEQMYKFSFHLQYKNPSNDSKNQIISKLQEEFPENWSTRHVRLLIAKTYNKKKRNEKVIFF